MAQVTINANTLTPPRWAADFLGPASLVPGGAKVVEAEFLTTDYTVTINQADVAEGDTSITVEALDVAIPSGTVLDFGAHTTGDISMVAITAADAAAAATSITTVELGHAIEDDAEATFTVDAANNTILSGTLIGRTYAERAAGTAFGPVATDGSDDEIFVVAFDVTDMTNNDDVELYRHGSAVYEDLLPEWADLTSAVKTDLRAAYDTMVS